jgi:chromosomal replication initiator protein
VAEVLRTTVREALRESEGAQMARANLRDLEARDAEKLKRARHASVRTFPNSRRGRGAAGGNPESHVQGDERVLAALSSERLLDWFTFDTFFAGKLNAFTYRLCEAVATQPGGEYNPFFLYGDVGLGKTHLINAVGNAILARDPDQRIGYVSSSRFATRLVEAIRDQATDAFRANYCHWEVLILDDIQFLGGRVEAQEEFFHIFNVLQQEGRQVIIAGDKPPDRLGLLEQRLISRFAGGLVAPLRPPEWETRLAILQHHVAESGVPVDEEILSLIAMRVPNDVRKMIGALRKVTAFAALTEEPLTCELANEILSHLGIEEAA